MMQYKGYMGHVEYDDEAKILHGRVLGITDVITFQADTAREIEKAFRDSVDDYLQFCAQRGECFQTDFEFLDDRSPHRLERVTKRQVIRRMTDDRKLMLFERGVREQAQELRVLLVMLHHGAR